MRRLSFDFVVECAAKGLMRSPAVRAVEVGQSEIAEIQLIVCGRQCSHGRSAFAGSFLETVG